MNHGFMTFSYPKASLAAIIEDATQFGYTGIELRIGRNQGHGLEIDSSHELLTAARSQAESEGVHLYSLASSFQLAVEELDEEEARQTLAMATAIGSRVIRVFGGAFKDEGLDLASARSRLVSGLRRFSELSKELTAGSADDTGPGRRGGVAGSADGSVVIALESHDAWTDATVLAEVLAEVSKDNVGLNWDPYHIVRMHGTSVADHFPTIRAWVKHVHVHDGTATTGAPVLTSVGTGIVDHEAMIRGLMEIGFDGFLMGEWIHSLMEGNTDPVIYLPRELKKLRKIEASLE